MVKRMKKLLVLLLTASVVSTLPAVSSLAASEGADMVIQSELSSEAEARDIEKSEDANTEDREKTDADKLTAEKSEAEEQKKAEEAAKAEEQKKAEEEAARVEEQKKAEEEAAKEEEQKKAEEEAAKAEEQKKTEEEAAKAEEQKKAEEEATKAEESRLLIEQAAAEAAASEEFLSAYSLPGAIFDDVSETDWYCGYVGYVLSKGIMTGKGNNIFAGAETLSRAQFATILYRLSGSPKVGYNTRFTDVSDGAFYTSPVLWAAQESVGVISGYQDGRFGPSDAITREQMATLLLRYAQYNGFDTTKSVELGSFPDAGTVSTFASNAMKWIVAEGIITGDQGKLNPQGTTSRAVCATMIQRFTSKFMKDLPDVDISASCSKVDMTMIDQSAGSFWVKVSGVKASHGVQKVQVPVWSEDDGSDVVWYEAAKQDDGSYGVLAEIKNHGYHIGTYYTTAYVLLTNGVRLEVGNQKLTVEASPAQVRIQGHTEDVYQEVGRDLQACYWWTANHISYKTLPIPLDPPDGFTRAEWYSILGFEEGQGNCYVFAATFYWLAKNLGYDVEFVEGQVGMAAGGYGPHGWVVVHLNGGSYICDPEAQYEGIGGRNFYMQPINSPILRYRW